MTQTFSLLCHNLPTESNSGHGIRTSTMVLELADHKIQELEKKGLLPKGK
jgi:hypothetical protein